MWFKKENDELSLEFRVAKSEAKLEFSEHLVSTLMLALESAVKETEHFSAENKRTREQMSALISENIRLRESVQKEAKRTSNP